MMLQCCKSCVDARQQPWSWLLLNSYACMQQWVNSESVVIGTKCNKLLSLNVSSRQTAFVALPITSGRPAVLEAHSTPYKHCGIHCIAQSPDGSCLATGGHDPSDCQVFNISEPASRAQLPSYAPFQTLMVGICQLSGFSLCTEYALEQM